MSLTGGFFVEEFDVGCNALEIAGNGRRARDDGKEGFRLGMIRCAANRPLWGESASGDDTKGRDIVIVARQAKWQFITVIHKTQEQQQSYLVRSKFKLCNKNKDTES